MLLIYRADNNHDVVELQAKHEPKAQPVGNDNFIYGEWEWEFAKEPCISGC